METRGMPSELKARSASPAFSDNAMHVMRIATDKIEDAVPTAAGATSTR
jgi:hypothetical protein